MGKLFGILIAIIFIQEAVKVSSLCKTNQTVIGTSNEGKLLLTPSNCLI